MINDRLFKELITQRLRLLATLKLNPAKMQLIGRFIERYLRLARDEEEAR